MSWRSHRQSVVASRCPCIVTRRICALRLRAMSNVEFVDPLQATVWRSRQRHNVP